MQQRPHTRSPPPTHPGGASLSSDAVGGEANPILSCDSRLTPLGRNTIDWTERDDTAERVCPSSSNGSDDTATESGSIRGSSSWQTSHHDATEREALLFDKERRGAASHEGTTEEQRRHELQLPHVLGRDGARGQAGDGEEDGNATGRSGTYNTRPSSDGGQFAFSNRDEATDEDTSDMGDGSEEMTEEGADMSGSFSTTDDGQPRTQPRRGLPTSEQAKASVLRRLISEYNQVRENRLRNLRNSNANPYYDHVSLPSAPREGMSVLNRSSPTTSAVYTHPGSAPMDSAVRNNESSNNVAHTDASSGAFGPIPATGGLSLTEATIVQEEERHDYRCSERRDPSLTPTVVTITTGSVVPRGSLGAGVAPLAGRVVSTSPLSTADAPFDVSQRASRPPATVTGGRDEAGSLRKPSSSAPPRVVTKDPVPSRAKCRKPRATAQGSAKFRREMSSQHSLTSFTSNSHAHSDGTPEASSSRTSPSVSVPLATLQRLPPRTPEAGPTPGPDYRIPSKQQLESPRVIKKTCPFARSVSSSAALLSSTGGGASFQSPSARSGKTLSANSTLSSAASTLNLPPRPQPPSPRAAHPSLPSHADGNHKPERARAKGSETPLSPSPEPVALPPKRNPLAATTATGARSTSAPTNAAAKWTSSSTSSSSVPINTTANRSSPLPAAAATAARAKVAKTRPASNSGTPPPPAPLQRTSTPAGTPPPPPPQQQQRPNPLPTDDPDILVPAVKYSYDVKRCHWSTSHFMVRVLHPNRGLSQGGMRVAFEVEELDDRGFGSEMVAKMFRHNILDVVEDDYLSECEAQCLCEEFADSFNKVRVEEGVSKANISFLQCSVVKIPKEDIPEAYKAARKGFFSYRTTDTRDILFNMEPKLNGNFTKYTSNFGDVYETNERYIPPSQDRQRRRILEAVEAFSHFTLVESGGSMLVCDLQGVQDFLTDPQIHTEDGKGLGMGNMGQEGIDEWVKTHRCKDLCRAMRLQPLTDGVGSLTDKKRGSYFRAMVSRLQREELVQPQDLIPLPKPLEDMTDEERFEYAVRLSEMMDT